MKRQQFTLIELLVVIAIIAILAGIPCLFAFPKHPDREIMQENANRNISSFFMA